MKKLFVLLFVALAAVACDDPAHETEWIIADFEVRGSAWQYGSEAGGWNHYYYCSFDFPELTGYVFDSGNVQAYLYNGNRQQPLPYGQHYEGTDGGGNWINWTKTIDFDFAPGNITFYVTDSEFVNERPGDMDFRVVLTW